MVNVKLKEGNVLLKFPQNIVSGIYLKKLIERLEIEEVASINKMEIRESNRISGDIKQRWWANNSEDILSRINKI